MPRLRYQRVGLVIGGLPGAPGPSEAKEETEAATVPLVAASHWLVGWRSPCSSTSSAATARSSSHAMASAPITSAAVVAVLAALHVCPRAVTERQGPATAGRWPGRARVPARPPRVQRRARTVEVATPPDHSCRSTFSPGRCGEVRTRLTDDDRPAVRGMAR